MITCDFTGNVGNHMFQYALTRTVAEYNGFEWGFNPVVSNDYYNGWSQMDFMNIDYGKVHKAKWKEMPEGVYREWVEPTETFYHIDRVDNHPYTSEVFEVQDGTKLVISSGQDARYYTKKNLQSWFKIRYENVEKYNRVLKENNVELDENICVVNVRGGEYRGIPTLLLTHQYWYNAMKIMIEKNYKIKFICVTDDIAYAKQLFDIPTFHFGIGMDYYVINNAKNLIISNSSFAILPTWLNENNPFVIAPKYWARHNVSNGYWCGNIWTFDGFNFLGKDGTLSIS